MEEHLDKIVYLIIAFVYTIFSHGRKRDTAVPPAKDGAEDLLPPSVPAWGATQEKPATTPYPQATPPALSPVYPQPHSTPKAAAQQQSQPTKDRVLSRYSGWKRAIVMQEIMRPPT